MPTRSVEPARCGNAARQTGDGQLWRSISRGVLFAAGGALLLEAAYLVFVIALLPRYFEDAARRAGLELTFAALRSWHPGRVQLEAPRLVAPGGWSLTSEHLDLRCELSSLVWGYKRVTRANAVDTNFDWNSNHIGPAAVRLQVDGTASDGRQGWAFVDGSRARFRLGPWSGRLDLHAHVRLELPGLESEEGAVTASLSAALPPAGRLERSRGQGPVRSPEVQLSLRWSDAAFSAEQGFALRGQLNVVGEDAGVWLDLANASSSVRWMLAELAGQPFDLEAAVRMQRDGVAVEQVRLEAGLTEARGAVYWNGQRRGAFLLQRGTGTIGIVVSGADVSAELMPDPGWLTRQLELARQSLAHGSH